MNVHATGSAEIASNLTPRLATVSLPVVGMTCASCVGRVEKALNRVEGVGKATVAKQAGATVVGGTVNQTGALTFRVNSSKVRDPAV